MADLPIIFSAPMILALLAGRKTMTRRLAWGKPMPGLYESSGGPLTPVPRRSPWQRVKTGDRLWVREAFRVQQINRIIDSGGPYFHVCIDHAADGHRSWVKVYEADAPKVLRKRRGPSGEQTAALPSIHMPKVCSRLTLVVTATKTEAVQEITMADVTAEGWEPRSIVSDDPEVHRDAARDWFSDLWEDLHGVESWRSNPEVVALSFRAYRQNIDGR
jgi:hypothetical protein